MDGKASTKTRAEAIQIILNPSCIEELDQNTYAIMSQSSDERYRVVVGNEAQYCTCKGSRKGAVACKHIVAARMYREVMKMVEGSKARMRERVPGSIAVTIPEKLPLYCTECLSENYVCNGKRPIGDEEKGTARIRQRYKCKDCGKRFSGDLETWGLVLDPDACAHLVAAYFEGRSAQEVVDHMWQHHGIRISKSAVCAYANRFVRLVVEFLRTIGPALSDSWSIDDLQRGAKESARYFYFVMDHVTRYIMDMILVENKGSSDIKPLLRSAKKIAGGIPVLLTSDADPSIARAARVVLAKKGEDGERARTVHMAGAHIRGVRTANRHERCNRTMGKPLRRYGLALSKGVCLPMGHVVHYNFARKHTTIGGTPAEAAGIQVMGHNVWKTLIHNAAWSRLTGAIRRSKRRRKRSRKRRVAPNCHPLTKWMDAVPGHCTA